MDDAGRVALDFEWDDDKARDNWLKHHVSFAEASTVFGDPLAFTIDDPLHSEGEDRLITTGRSVLGLTIIVVHTQRRRTIRLISARRATPRERRCYERFAEPNG